MLVILLMMMMMLQLLSLEEIQSAVIEATAQTMLLEHCREANRHCIRLIQTVRDKDMYVVSSTI